MKELQSNKDKQSGIKIAKEKGIKFGRPKANLPKNHLEIFDGYICKELSSERAMELLEVSRGTFFKLLKVYRELIVY